MRQGCSRPLDEERIGDTPQKQPKAYRIFDSEPQLPQGRGKKDEASFKASQTEANEAAHDDGRILENPKALLVESQYFSQATAVDMSQEMMISGRFKGEHDQIHVSSLPEHKPTSVIQSEISQSKVSFHTQNTLWGYQPVPVLSLTSD